jgi:hypothetical protein
MFAGIQRGFAWIDEHRDEIGEFWEGAKGRSDGDWAYLLDLIDPFTAISVALTLEAEARVDPRFRDSIHQVLEDGLTEPTLLGELHEAITEADLPDAQKKQLHSGLDHVASQEYELAVPLLMNPLEGALFRLAESRGLVEKDRNSKWHATAASGKPGKPIRGVEAVVTLDNFDLSPAFVQFARAVAYGTPGHPFRHGTADEGWPLRAMFMVVGLVGWLEAQCKLDGRRAVRAAFIREHQRRSAERDERRAVST